MAIESKPDRNRLVEAFDRHRQRIEPAQCPLRDLIRRPRFKASDRHSVTEPAEHHDRAVETQQLGREMRQDEKGGAHRRIRLAKLHCRLGEPNGVMR